MFHYESLSIALEALKAGQFIILVDDEHRENEGDLVLSASHVTPEKIAFMATHGRGLICMPMAPTLVDQLNLPPMVTQNRSLHETGFTISIGARTGITTGISAHDRAKTILSAIADDVTPDDIVSPGHVFPLRAREGGVLERAGHTEASVDLMMLAGLKPATVICEIMNDDGKMARRSDLDRFSEQYHIPILNIQDLIHYRRQYEELVSLEAECDIPLKGRGVFHWMVFKNKLDNQEHVVLIRPPIEPHKIPLVRIHSSCMTGDIFNSERCDCGWQLDQSLDLFAEKGGVLIYLQQEGRGIGLANKIKAYQLQIAGFDTVDANLELGFRADERDYLIAYQLLKYLGIHSLRLISNNPDKKSALVQYGLDVVEMISLFMPTNQHNRVYLETKKNKLGHLIEAI